jgi:hypothetical protein
MHLPHAEPRLPARAARRRRNRGIEGIAVSPDERWIYVALQSAPDGEDPGQTPIWKLDAKTGKLAIEAAYPFDEPESFKADADAGHVGRGDLKICELVCLAEDVLLVLERISKSARIYRVELTRHGHARKELVFSTDAAGGIAPDIEGMTLLSDRELILATDNDFAVEGAVTHFYRLGFHKPLTD